MKFLQHVVEALVGIHKEFEKKSKQRFWRGQRSKYLQRCGSCVLYRMKPYKNSNESPFFMLQDGAFNIKIQSKMAKLQGNK